MLGLREAEHALSLLMNETGCSSAGVDHWFDPQQAHIRTALDSALMAAWELDMETFKMRRTSNAPELFGLPEEEQFTGVIESYRVLHAEDLARHALIIEEAFVLGTSYISRFRLIRPDNGEVVWVEDSGRAYKNKDGKVVKVAGVLRDISALKRFEEEARLSEQRLKAALNSSRVSLFNLDKNLRVTWASGSSLWYSVQELLGKEPEELFGKNEGARLRNLCVQVLETGQGARGEFNLRHGLLEVDIEFFVQPLHDAEGRVIGLTNSAIDITERKRSARALEITQQRYQVLFDSNLVGVVYGDLDGRIFEANDQFLQMVGAQRNELEDAGLRWLDNNDPETEQEAIRQAILSGSCHPYQKQYIRPDGSSTWVQVGFAILDKGSSEIIAIFLDISRQKEVEHQLVQSKDRFEVALQNAPVVLFNHDTELRYTWIHNPVWRPTVEETLGHTDLDFLSEKDASHLMQIKQNVLETQRGSRSEVHINIDGKPHYFDLTVEPLIGKEGLSGIACAAIDITDLKCAQEALKEADKRKDEFLAMLAHEIRNPLAALSAAYRLLQSDRLDDFHKAWSRDVIERQLGQLSRIIDDLLDVSRITRGKIRLEKERVDISDILNKAIESTQPENGANGRVLIREGAVKGLFTEADPTRMEQIFTNLIKNAFKYTHQDGIIRISAEQKDSSIVIRVKDNGVGISGDMLPRIFDLFSQADTSLDRAAGGLGIGLTIVKKLVDLHGGTITANSTGVGEGSEFVVTLPAAMVTVDTSSLVEVPVESSSIPELLTTSFEQNGQRILIVEDNRDTAKALRLVLEEKGHTVEMAFNGVEALNTFRRFCPQVVLLDIGLPGVSGFEVAQQLRAASKNAEHPLIIAVTGYGQPQDVCKSIESGFDLHLVKPVNLDKLDSILKGLQPPGGYKAHPFVADSFGIQQT